MRVALPVDPFFKTESEVATIQYVREHTQLPVPHIVAFSSASNPLGFEWILMERVNGVPVDSVWDDMPFKSKVAFTEELASKVRPLLALRFSLLGNLYFADIWNQVGYSPPLKPAHEHAEKLDMDIGVNGDYVIGCMVSTRFFRDKSLLLSNNRGPFRTIRDLVLAEIDLLGQRVAHLSPSPDDEYHTGCDKELAAAGPEVHVVFDKFRALVARTSPGCIFPPTPSADNNYTFPGINDTPSADNNHASTIINDTPSADNNYASTVINDTLSADYNYASSKTINAQPEDLPLLWHDDLSRMHILINPSTFQLAGIVDWESVSIVPTWEATPAPASSSPFAIPDDNPDSTNPSTYAVPIPYFLRGIEVLEPPPRDEVTDEEEEEYYADIRKDWELGLFRRRFCEVIPPLFDLEREEEASVRLGVVKAKKKVAEALGDFEDRWEATRYALRKGLFGVDVHGGKDGEEGKEGVREEGEEGEAQEEDEAKVDRDEDKD